MMRQPFARGIGAVLVAAALPAALLTGCSQVKAISPVGGRITLVRFAAIDVLIGQRVDVMTAPVCTENAAHSISCVGATVKNEAVTVTSVGDDSANMQVMVGGTRIYDGSIQDVLDANARPTS